MVCMQVPVLLRSLINKLPLPEIPHGTEGLIETAKARDLLLALSTCKVVDIHSKTRQCLDQPCITYSVKQLRLLICRLPVQNAQLGGIAVSHA